ncbi:MAG: beta-ketoacyl-ACP synthase II, partial [Halothiobacillus sp.]|nr:beta-ketoacyl-ACP synthase II [Halothiobacillus sp.]
MSKQRVVVTGLGALTPLGNTVATSWAGILEGRSGVRRIDCFDVSAMASQIAATLRDFDAAQFIPAKEIKKMEPFIHYGMAAAIEAIEDAGLISDTLNYDRVGTLIGSGIGGLEGIERNTMTLAQQGPRRVS